MYLCTGLTPDQIKQNLKVWYWASVYFLMLPWVLSRTFSQRAKPKSPWPSAAPPALIPSSTWAALSGMQGSQPGMNV